MSKSQLHIPELLAPAGGPEALRAAIANGADAVYLGVEMLNARRGAENFSLDTLSETCRFAHLRGARVYLTANVVVLPDELVEALEMVDAAWVAGVDAVIVQDLGLLRAVRLTLPHVRVHSSTQMNAHNTQTIRALADLGIMRVTLAREVSVDEIGGFVEADVVEIESFVHGALCMCYSGQCLMSSLIGRRSANRGLCAQPCRLPYELLDGGGDVLEAPGAHLLSPKDLAGITMLPRLVRAGVSALKIEGRMKSAEYVALVTGVYRAALDRAGYDPEEFEVRDGEMAVLSESFSRGFTEAYLHGERGNEMMSYRRPNNRGVPVGRVTAVEGRRVTIALDAPLEAEDVVEFWTSSGRFAQAAGPLTFSGADHVAAPAGVHATLTAEKSVTTGDRVFRVRNSALAAAARRTFVEVDDIAPVDLAFSVRVVVGEPLSVEVRDDSGRIGAAHGGLVEMARTKAVSAAEIEEHIGRLGGTPYRIGGWSLELAPNVGIGFSSLHRVRREALAAYERASLSAWSARERVHPSLPRVSPLRRTHAIPELVAAVEDMGSARACLEAGASVVNVPTYALRSSEALANGVVPLIPRIVHDREVASALAFAEPGRRVVVGNLGLIGPAAQAGAQVEAHWSLNAVNHLAVAQLAEMGAATVWLSPELSGRQIAEIVTLAPVPLGTAVYGRQEVMVTEHCVLMAEGECDRRCGTCHRRAGVRMLRDRKGYLFPVRTDITGRSHVYNSVPLNLTSALPEILAAGISALRIDVATESASEAAAVVSRVRSALEAAYRHPGQSAVAKDPRSTSGHFFRGLI